MKFFGDKPEKFLSKIGPLLKTVRLRENEVIYSENEPAHDVFFIKEGTVCLFMQKYQNFRFISIKKGFYFGDIDVLFTQTRRYSAVAASNVEL